uniref:Reverse transcriptase Ty1/copia-type domain-containing protein n=1 Tax=Solanum lycopersicum TaxID=4081 RepID=A0A3Q7ITP7_SOLLC
MMITGNDIRLIQETKQTLQDTFKMKDLGDLKYFLGIEFTLEIISEVGLSAPKPATTPLDSFVKLTTKKYDEVNNIGHDDKLLEDPNIYKRLIGKLFYLTVTRPDIAYATQTLSQFLQQPKQSHLNETLKVVRYIKGEAGWGILLSSKSSKHLNVYCDLDLATYPQTRRSVPGVLINLENSLISGKTKKQGTVSRSSTEAEYRSMANFVAEVVWIVSLFKELGEEIETSVIVHSDSKSTIQIATNPLNHERTKHIELDCHFIREKIQKGVIETRHLSTKEQIADLLTKGLGRSKYEYLLSMFGVINLFIPSNLRGSIKEGIT